MAHGYGTVTIASAASLSGSLSLNGKGLVRIIMPAAWTAATLTFQESVDNSTFGDKFDDLGDEYEIDAVASRAILIDADDFRNVRWLKVRSGTTGTPVVQGAARTLVLVYESLT